MVDSIKYFDMAV